MTSINTTPLKLALVIAVGIGLVGAVATVGAHDADATNSTEMPEWNDHTSGELIDLINEHHDGDSVPGEYHGDEHVPGEYHDDEHVPGEYHDDGGHC